MTFRSRWKVVDRVPKPNTTITIAAAAAAKVIHRARRELPQLMKRRKWNRRRCLSLQIQYWDLGIIENGEDHDGEGRCQNQPGLAIGSGRVGVRTSKDFESDDRGGVGDRNPCASCNMNCM